MTKKSYILRSLIAIDQLLNVLVLNGHEDQTISGKVGYKALTSTKTRWKVAEKIINLLFFFDHNHCYNSIEWDRIYKEN